MCCRFLWWSIPHRPHKCTPATDLIPLASLGAPGLSVYCECSCERFSLDACSRGCDLVPTWSPGGTSLLLGPPRGHVRDRFHWLPGMVLCVVQSVDTNTPTRGDISPGQNHVGVARILTLRICLLESLCYCLILFYWSSLPLFVHNITPLPISDSVLLQKEFMNFIRTCVYPDNPQQYRILRQKLLVVRGTVQTPTISKGDIETPPLKVGWVANNGGVG